MKTKRLETFTVYGKLSLEVSAQIRAESLADAVFKSSELDESDFVEFFGEYIDGKLRITAVLEG